MNAMEEATDFTQSGGGGVILRPLPDAVAATPCQADQSTAAATTHAPNSAAFPENAMAGKVEEEERENDFPGRPYASVRDAITAGDIEAIAPFIQQENFNPDQRGDQNKT